MKKNKKEGPWKGKSSLYILWFLGPPKKTSHRGRPPTAEALFLNTNFIAPALMLFFVERIKSLLPDSSSLSNLYLRQGMNRNIWIESEGTCGFNTVNQKQSSVGGLS